MLLVAAATPFGLTAVLALAGRGRSVRENDGLAIRCTPIAVLVSLAEAPSFQVHAIGLWGGRGLPLFTAPIQVRAVFKGRDVTGDRHPVAKRNQTVPFVRTIGEHFPISTSGGVSAAGPRLATSFALRYVVHV